MGGRKRGVTVLKSLVQGHNVCSGLKPKAPTLRLVFMIHSSTLFTQQIFTEHLVCGRHHSRYQECNSKQNKVLILMELIFQWGNQTYIEGNIVHEMMTRIIKKIKQAHKRVGCAASLRREMGIPILYKIENISTLSSRNIM